MKLVRFKTDSGSPNSQEWHDWRDLGLGASDSVHIAAKAGIIPSPPSWCNGKKLLAQKLRVAKPIKVNWRMTRGTLLEEDGRERFEEKSSDFMAEQALKDDGFSQFQKETGLVMMPCFGEMDSHPFIKASYDGMDFWGRILEIKCPSQEVHNMAKAGEVVTYYRPQLAQQLLVRHGEPKNWTGNEEVYFATYNPDDEDGQDLAIVPLKSSEFRQMASMLLNANITFYNKWQSLKKLDLPKRLKEFEKKHEGLLSTYSEAKAKGKIALEYIKQQIQEKDYKPSYHSTKIQSRKSGKLDEDKLLKRLFWDNVPPEYRNPSYSVLRLEQPDIVYRDVLEAEKDLIESKEIIKAFEPEFEKAKEEMDKLAGQIGYMQGEHFSYYEVAGRINWKMICEDNEIDINDFKDYTESSSLVLKALPKAKEQSVA